MREMEETKTTDAIPVDIADVIKKLPHSESRVPYTYHHDYLRQNCQSFAGKSRSEVAQLHSSDMLELYATALVAVLGESDWQDIFNLSLQDIKVCNRAKDITDKMMKR